MFLLLLPALTLAAPRAEKPVVGKPEVVKSEVVKPAVAVAPPATAEVAADPWEVLVQQRGALAAALLARGADADTLAAVAEVLADADARLVDLLLPARPGGALPDALGEDRRVDLFDADVWLEGSTLKGIVRGRGVAENGVWIDVDLEDGPAPDLELGFGRGWTRANPLDGGTSPASGPYPLVEPDRITFSLDLAHSGRLGRGLAGAATARLKAPDGGTEDAGPAGLLGPPPDEAIDVLLALVGGAPVRDADLAVALAVTFGAVRPLVADALVATVDADAVAWLRYGEGLDAWLASAGAEWRFGTLDPLGKLTWAWPAAQAVVYGAVPLAGERSLLDAARYRFVVPDTATLARLRVRAPLAPSALETARNVDRGVNATLRYRAYGPLMDTLCRNGTRTDEECRAWQLDRRNGADLGKLGDVAAPGRVVALWEGVSATWQSGVFAREATYVGDCATATALTIGTLQALGIPAIGMGWSGEDLNTPTHDVPLWYDGATFRATQRGPGPAWNAAPAFVYVTLPAVHPVNAWTIGREPGGWSRGGAVAGGWITYGALTQLLRDGLAGTRVGGWIDVQAAGGWPVF
ncbi:MAG: hypothetical protein Q8P18_26770 [Pseudomonadota bacterium]|nr:hypothetical protein [Pseudomonadota bacterium]